MNDRWSNARNILAIRLDNLGDVLMTTPALAAIRESVPDARLTLLASPAGAALAECIPEVDDTIVFEAPWVKPAGARLDAMPGEAELQLVGRLAARCFDAAVIFTVCTQSALPAALMCRMAGIPLRLAHSRENPYGLLSDWVSDTDQLGDGMRHEVARQLALVASVGFRVRDDRLRMAAHARHRLAMRERLREAGVPDDQPYFVVHPGATAASRRWPAERFGIAADAIAQRSGCLAVWSGDAHERMLIRHGRAAMQRDSVSVAGQLAVGELAALIAESRLLLSNNTGPAHIAAAMGTPVVVLYALTNPQHTPWKVPRRVLSHDVPCRHCLKSICPEGHHACLERVEPEAVIASALALLEPADDTRGVAAPPAPAVPAMSRRIAIWPGAAA